MNYSDDYSLGLHYLIYLIISADKVIEPSELKAMSQILFHEGIEEKTYLKNLEVIKGKREREIYERGIDLISKCTDDEKRRAFAWLYKMSEVDGHIHVKEVRFLLYSIKHAGIDLDDVIGLSKSLPQLTI